MRCSECPSNSRQGRSYKTRGAGIPGAFLFLSMRKRRAQAATPESARSRRRTRSSFVNGRTSRWSMPSGVPGCARYTEDRPGWSLRSVPRVPGPTCQGRTAPRRRRRRSCVRHTSTACRNARPRGREILAFEHARDDRTKFGVGIDEQHPARLAGGIKRRSAWSRKYTPSVVSFRNCCGWGSALSMAQPRCRSIQA